MRNLFLLTLLSVVLSINLKAQCPKDSLLMARYFKEAKSLVYKESKQSIILCDSIILLAYKNGCKEKEAYAMLLKAEAAIVDGNLKMVKESLDLVSRCNSNNEIKDKNKARQIQVARKSTLADYYFAMGRQKESLDTLEALLKELGALPIHDSQDSFDLRQNYVDAGTISMFRGDYGKAENCYLKALRWNNNEYRYVVFIAKLYTASGAFEKAKKSYLDYFSNRAIQGYKNIEINNNLSSAYRGIADVYFHTGQLDSARYYLKESLKCIDKENGSYPTSCYMIGKVHLAKNDYYSAIQNFKEGLKYKRKRLEKTKHIDYAQFYQGIGEAYVGQGKLQEGLKKYQQAMIHLVPKFNSHDFRQNPPLNNPNSHKYLLEVFAKKIETLYALQKTDAAKYSKLALSTTQIAIDLIDSIRLGIFEVNDQQFLLAQSYSIYEKAIDLAVDREDFEMAFNLSEKSRAVALYEALKIKKAEARAALPESLLIREFEIRRQLIKSEQQLLAASKGSNLLIQKLNLQIYDLKQDYASLQREMQKDSNFKAAMKEMTIVTHQDIADIYLAPGQAMLQFFTGEDHLYSFLIHSGNKTMEVRKIAWTPELTEAITEINNSIYEKGTAHIRYARLLYDTLLAPSFKNGLPESLVIVPDGILGYVPFCALITKEVKKSDIRKFKKHAYLNKEVALSQWYSASSFVVTQYPDPEWNKKWEYDLLAYAPGFPSTGDVAMRSDSTRGQLYPLEYNEAEIEFIAKAFRNYWLIKGKEASKDHFLRNGSRSRILHFATHGAVNKKHPELSFIAFAYLEGTSDWLFKLGLNELYNMNLSAEMIVLSACNTGLGKIVKGEGAMSIARGFAYAGARSILTTLWSVDDKSTSLLMNEFYKSLKDGQRKDQALQSSVRDYIETIAKVNDEAHPYYWAALTVIGNTNPISFESDSFFKIAWFFLILFLIALAYYFYRKHQSN